MVGLSVGKPLGGELDYPWVLIVREGRRRNPRRIQDLKTLVAGPINQLRSEESYPQEKTPCQRQHRHCATPQLQPGAAMTQLETQPNSSGHPSPRNYSGSHTPLSSTK